MRVGQDSGCQRRAGCPRSTVSDHPTARHGAQSPLYPSLRWALSVEHSPRCPGSTQGPLQREQLRVLGRTRPDNGASCKENTRPSEGRRGAPGRRELSRESLGGKVGASRVMLRSRGFAVSQCVCTFVYTYICLHVDVLTYVYVRMEIHPCVCSGMHILRYSCIN